ncbi:hypothetical protein [Pseudomonas purpurea]|uniref:hypothetical protein n=1 Tax=Pseudomonas purpurea TaxID=3136737 RepID=UPI0032654DF8
MSNSKRNAMMVALALMSGTVAAHELPQSSILTRYGVTPDQLQLPAVAMVKPKEEPPKESLFKLQPEQPWANVHIGDNKAPEVTGNISIDNSFAKDYERCLKFKQQLTQHGSRDSISCDNTFPWQGDGSRLR